MRVSSYTMYIYIIAFKSKIMHNSWSCIYRRWAGTTAAYIAIHNKEKVSEPANVYISSTSDIAIANSSYLARNRIRI